MGYFPLPELKGKPNRIFVDGKTLNQIAKESGIRLDTVQHRYSRGIRDYEGLTKPSHIRVEHEKAQRKTYSIMSMMEWAKREVEIAYKRERGDKPESEWDYGCACYNSALKAFESLCGDGHSGFSIGITKGILNRLIEGKPLTPIEDTEDVWNVCSRGENGGVATYQCKRMSSLFKDVYPDGTVKYHDNDRYYCIKWDDPNLCWHNGFIGKIYSEMFPLTMPYMPSNKADVIVCDELLTDRKNGDFDTLAVLYIQRSHGEKVEVNRYFKEGEKSFIEISPEEYEERKKMHEKRQEQEAKAQDEN